MQKPNVSVRRLKKKKNLLDILAQLTMSRPKYNYLIINFTTNKRFLKEYAVKTVFISLTSLVITSLSLHSNITSFLKQQEVFDSRDDVVRTFVWGVLFVNIPNYLSTKPRGRNIIEYENILEKYILYHIFSI